jgi:hypothetical protein
MLQSADKELYSIQFASTSLTIKISCQKIQSGKKNKKAALPRGKAA